ncbi:uncharacterized protein N7525_008783 [Penicillium rubens]|uniref:uncharacterized protein n=1 Tax=Penicillium rubens TaxID=1108849 RepID=UPI002A5AF6FD|nr:uncharacterized protein N7525_008783 [Penicillium rubens]KAJ5830530.1 hypothetical protein N7525_008783 [Penicillium rubens]
MTYFSKCQNSLQYKQSAAAFPARAWVEPVFGEEPTNSSPDPTAGGLVVTYSWLSHYLLLPSTLLATCWTSLWLG